VEAAGQVTAPAHTLYEIVRKLPEGADVSLSYTGDDPRLLVQVENGYFDFATPFFATEYTMTHLGLPDALQKNIKEDYYSAGHMMYLHDEDRVALHGQIAGFIERATKQ